MRVQSGPCCSVLLEDMVPYELRQSAGCRTNDHDFSWAVTAGRGPARKNFCRERTLRISHENGHSRILWSSDDAVVIVVAAGILAEEIAAKTEKAPEVAQRRGDGREIGGSSYGTVLNFDGCVVLRKSPTFPMVMAVFRGNCTAARDPGQVVVQSIRGHHPGLSWISAAVFPERRCI